MNPNRIDPLGPPPATQRKPLPAWARRLVIAGAGAAVGALCPFIPLAPVRAVCVAVSSVVSSVPVTFEADTKEGQRP